MRISKLHEGENSNIYTGNKEKSNLSVKDDRNHNKKQTEKSSVYAGDLNINMQDSPITKKVSAQKQALKKVLDQLKKDQKLDNNLELRRQHQTDLSEEAKASLKQMNKIDEMKIELKEAYDISDDSTEQKNLELLEKSMDPKQTIIKEEMEQLRNMGPLTDYQKTALEYDTMSRIWKIRYDNANITKTNEGKTIEAIKIERLKSHEMLDCQKEAADIMEKATKEVLGTLWDDTKDNIDKDMEAKEDEAKKQTIEQEELKNHIEEVKEKNDMATNNEQDNSKSPAMSERNINTIHSQQLQENDNNLKQLQTELKSFMKKNNLLEEDMKGLEVDQQF
jgi:hypothetical protein